MGHLYPKLLQNAALIICLLTAVVHSWLKRAVDPLREEISLDKLVKKLLVMNGYALLLFGLISRLENTLLRDLQSLKKQKRKRKTTLERVLNLEAYSEKYEKNF